MFPPLRDRAARALDLAIEFATLGEYRLDAPASGPLAPAGPARGGARRAEPAGRRSGAPARPAPRMLPAARLVTPGTAAARLRQAPPHAALTKPAKRSRGGSVEPVPQPCETPRR